MKLHKVRSIFQQVSLTPKMLFIMILIGTAILGVLNHVFSETLSRALLQQQSERLEREAQDSRTRFDSYVAAYSSAAHLIVSQRNYLEYLGQQSWGVNDSSVIKEYIRELPSWLPDASVMRSLVKIYFAILIDGGHRIREIYRGGEGEIPNALMNGESFLINESSGQSYLTTIDGHPFILVSEVSEAILSPGRLEKITLILASPLNDDFLLATQGFSPHQNIVALVDREKQTVVSSNQPILLPPGTALGPTDQRFLITGKSFFDGHADLYLQFTSLVSKEEYSRLIETILSAARKQYVIMATVFILSASLVMLWVTNKIRKLTLEITAFSTKVLGVQPTPFASIETGDEFHILNDRFHYLAREIASSQHALTNSNQALANSNQELEHFAYIASHDLQEPLRMVTSYLQLLVKRYHGKLDSDANEYIQFAVDGAKRMKILIESLLAYARLGTVKKSMISVNCQALCSNAIKNLQIVIQEKQAEIVINNSLPILLGDPAQLTELFQNLIANAIKFQGEKRPEVHVSASQKDAFWVFSVKDNGIGIDPRHFDRIFVIFQRLHTVQEYPGTGIGLSFCKKIVERHGGRIWIESELGKGTTFHFTLPSLMNEDTTQKELS